MNPQKNEQKDEAINQLNRGDQGSAKSPHPLFIISLSVDLASNGTWDRFLDLA